MSTFRELLAEMDGAEDTFANRVMRNSLAAASAKFDPQATTAETATIRIDTHAGPLGSCEVCHFHHSAIGERCTVHFFGEQCEGYIRPCCCGGTPVDGWRNDPAPRHANDETTTEETA